MAFTYDQIEEIEELIDKRVQEKYFRFSQNTEYTFPIMERFIVPKSGYNSNLIYALGQLCQLAYEEAERIEELLHLFDKEWVENFQYKFYDLNKGTQFFIISNRENVIVCFRGTETKSVRALQKDWITNLKIGQEDFQPYGQGKVHRGFKQSFALAWRQFLDYLDKHKVHGKNIWFTGHSLGGALATLCSAAFIGNAALTERNTFRGLYTFGQPRVGNRRFSAQFEKHIGKVIRIQNCNDPVTYLPTSIPFKSIYTHVGKEKTISWNGRFRPFRSDAALFLDRKIGMIKYLFPVVIFGTLSPPSAAKWIVKIIDRHSQLNYIQKIKVSSDKRWKRRANRKKNS